MTSDDLAALAVQLVEGAVSLARQQAQIDPDAVSAHLQAVAEARRTLIVQAGVTAGRIAVSAWTVPADSRDGTTGAMPLLSITRRVT